MTVVLIIAAWWLLLALCAWGICTSAGRADRVIESWDAERIEASGALALLGDDADGLWS